LLKKWLVDVIRNIANRRWKLYGRWLGAKRWLKARGMSLSGAATAMLILFLKKLSTALLGIRLWSTYHRCRNTSLWRFVEALRGDVSVLKRRFLPVSKRTLTEACSRLFSEFCELSGNTVSDHTLYKQKELIATRLQVEQLECLLHLYENGRNAEDKIYELTGVSSIEAAKATLVTWTNDYQQLLNEFENERQSGSDVKDTDISLMVVEVQKYLGFRISERTTTVAEFAGYVASFNRHVKTLNDKKD
jgi:hypothetical protein